MFKHKGIVVLVLSLELQLQQLLLEPASHLHRPALWLDVPTLAFVGSERDEIKGGITKDSRRKIDGRSVPYLRVANVQKGYLDLAVVKEINATEKEIAELKIERGDIERSGTKHKRITTGHLA